MYTKLESCVPAWFLFAGSFFSDFKRIYNGLGYSLCPESTAKKQINTIVFVGF
jgi:hypothetical protein